MSRELVVELIKRKKAIHQRTHDLVVAGLDAEEKLAFCVPSKEPELDQKLRDIKVQQLATKAELDRAYFFSRRYSHGLVPTLCSVCFVEHGESSVMVENKRLNLDGDRMFRCEKCKTEVRIATIISHP